jgi:hypothetical protein
MGLLDQAREDVKDIMADGDEWGVEITFTAPNASSCTVIGLHTKHHLGIDSDGNRSNSKTASISVVESHLVDNDYPVRNNNGEVSFRNHKASVKDSTGVVKNYMISEWFPDETLGIIVCILTDFA